MSYGGYPCACGCGQLTRPAKYRSGVSKYLHGHNRTKLLEQQYVVNDQTGCWEWARSVHPSGYGLIRRGQVDGNPAKQRLAHIYLYEQRCGPVPEGLQLDHLCRNRRCVNPDHLEPVTPAVNVRRGARTKLKEQDVCALRVLFAAGGITQAQLASIFKVSAGHVSDIIRRKKWRDTP